jgi:hypothetical protein
MLVFLKKLAVFGVVFIAFALLLQWLIDTGLRKSDYCIDYKEWYDIYHGNINADIIIQGTSRAKVHFSPAVFEKTFKMSTYNLGLSGSAFQLQYYRLKEYLKHNRKPSYIIQAVDCNLFQNASDLEFVQFAPYLNKALIDEFSGHFPYTYADLYLPLYKYRGSFGATAAGLDNIFTPTALNNGTYHGFTNFNRSYNGTQLQHLLKTYPNGVRADIIDTVYHSFVALIKYCKKENIKLILVWTPSVKQYQDLITNRQHVVRIYKVLAKKYDLTYLDYSDSPLCRDTSMFFDYFHLNAKGTAIFNEQVTGDLKNVIR